MIAEGDWDELQRLCVANATPLCDAWMRYLRQYPTLRAALLGLNERGDAPWVARVWTTGALAVWATRLRQSVPLFTTDSRLLRGPFDKEELDVLLLGLRGVVADMQRSTPAAATPTMDP